MEKKIAEQTQQHQLISWQGQVFSERESQFNETNDLNGIQSPNEPQIQPLNQQFVQDLHDKSESIQRQQLGATNPVSREIKRNYRRFSQQQNQKFSIFENMRKLNLVHKKIPRMDIPVDIEARYYNSQNDEDGKQEPAHNQRTAKANKQLFLKSYAIKFRIPVCYVIDSVIYSQDPQYVVQLIKYVLVEEQKDIRDRNGDLSSEPEFMGESLTNPVTTYTHQFNGDLTTETNRTLYAEYHNNLVLRVIKMHDTHIEHIDQVIIKNADTGIIKFDENGKYFAYMVPDKSKDEDTLYMINVIKIDKDKDGQKLLQNIRSETFECQFSSKDSFQNVNSEQVKNLKYITKLKFDINIKYLIGFGGQSFIMLNFKTGQGEMYTLDKKYQSILDINFKSSENDENDIDHKCHIGCRVRDLRQIEVIQFDFLKKKANYHQQQQQIRKIKLEKERQQQNSKMDHEDCGGGVGAEQTEQVSDHKIILPINLKHEPTEHLHFKISKNFKKMIYSDVNENFIVEQMNERHYVQKKLEELVDQIVMYIEEQDEEEQENEGKQDQMGFFLICSQKFDNKIKVLHSHKEKFKMEFKKIVQPGMIKIFDLNFTENILSLIGLVDDEFVIDKGTWSYTIISQDSPSRIQEKDISNAGQNQNDEMKQDQVQKQDAQQKEDKQQVVTGQYANKQPKYISDLEPEDLKDFKTKSMVYTVTNKFTVNWPYIAYQGLKNELIILNAFEQERVNRIELTDWDPDSADIYKNQKEISIQGTFISNTRDLFVLVYKNEEYKFYLYCLNLDDCNFREMPDINEELLGMNEKDLNRLTPDQMNILDRVSKLYKMGEALMWYDEEQVDDKKSFTRLHVRGSSNKEYIDFNEELFVIILHEDILYSWQKSKGKENAIEMVCKIYPHSLQVIDDNMLVFREDVLSSSNEVVCEMIKKLEIYKCRYVISTIFKDSSISDVLINFIYDYANHKIILFLQTETKFNIQQLFKFKIFDIRKSRFQFECQIMNQELIGRFFSGMYTFSNGYLYFGNNVIKIRYDLIENSCSSDSTTDKDVFDIYEGIFDLDKRYKVMVGTPLDSKQAHKFVYIFEDRFKQQPYIIYYLPYLHERKIYLNRIKKNTDYFYTSIETRVKDQIYFNKELLANARKQLDKNYELGPQYTSESSKKVKTFSSIICINKTEKKFYVYSQNGILQNRYNYQRDAKKYGQMKAISQNGLCFIFTKDSINLNIIRINAFELKKVDSFNIIDRIKKHIADKKKIFTDNEKEQRKLVVLSEDSPQYNEEWIQDFKENLEELILEINDNGDIGIKLKKTCKYDEHGVQNDSQTQNQPNNFSVRSNQQNIASIISQVTSQITEHDECKNEPNTIFFLVPSKNNPGTNQNLKDNSFFYCTYEADKMDLTRKCQHDPEKCDQDNNNFRINNQYMFIFSTKEIFYFDMTIDFESVQPEGIMQQLNINIHKDQKAITFVDVRMSISNKFVAIIQKNKMQKFSIYNWNIKDNIENDMYEVSDPFEILWDYSGHMYIAYEQKIIFDQSSSFLMTYDFQNLEDLDEDCDGHEMGEKMSKGVKFDGKNHNWLIFNEYIALPFCFLTFVIKDKIEENQCLQNQFDPEPWNFLFNRSTSFLSDSKIAYEHQLLSQVLQNFGKIDPDLLEMLYYTQTLDNYDEKEKQANQIHNKTELQMQIKRANTIQKNKIKKQEQNGKDNSLLKSLNEIVSSQKSQVKAKKQTFLHIVIHEGNGKCINMVLEYMTQTARCPTKNMVDIMSELVEYKDFLPFFEKLPFKTLSLQTKQTLKLKRTLSPDIVSMKETHTSFIDDIFFRSKMLERREENSFMSYPVDVLCFKFDWILTSNGRKFLSELRNNENLDIFRNKSINMIIEFMYQEMKSILLKTSIPIQCVNMITMMFLAQINEYNNSKNYLNPVLDRVDIQKRDEEGQNIDALFIVSTYVHLISTLYQIRFNWHIMMGMKRVYFKTFRNQMEILTIICNVFIQLQIRKTYVDDNEVGYIDLQEHKQKTQLLRYTFVVGILGVTFGIYNILGLVDQISPLMNIFFQIFTDIKYFMQILIITIITFSACFYIIGQNQTNFDNLDPSDLSLYPLKYDTVVGSLWYVFDILLGNFATKQFDLGEKSSQPILYFLFGLATFIIMIHLLNMLIAIMGNTYQENNDQSAQITYQSHLNFVLDNWFLLSEAFQNKRQYKYVVCAFASLEQEDENEKIKVIEEGLAMLEEQVEINQASIKRQMLQSEELIQNLNRRYDLGDQEFERINKDIKKLSDDVKEGLI